MNTGYGRTALRSLVLAARDIPAGLRVLNESGYLMVTTGQPAGHQMVTIRYERSIDYWPLTGHP